MSKVYDYILKHIIVNRFCIIPNWKWNIGPINTKKPVLSYLRVTVLGFVTVHRHTKKIVN